MAEYKILEGQSLFDVALQLYGDVTKVYELIRLNPNKIPNILATNLSGQTIIYEEQTNEVAQRFKTTGEVITSRYPETITIAAYTWSVAWSPPFTPAPTA